MKAYRKSLKRQRIHYINHQAKFNFMKVLTSVLLMVFILSCKFEAMKVKSEVNKDCLSELYLISNTTNEKKKRYDILFKLAKDSMPNLCKIDSTLMSYSIEFYSNTNSFKNYINGSDNRKDSEFIIELFEDNYRGGFFYRRDKVLRNMWYLTYPKEFNDTIYCE